MTSNEPVRTEDQNALYHLGRRSLASGSCASVLSSLALASMGALDSRSAFAPVNAVSHWVWGDRALGADRFSVRHTVLGYVIHHSMSVFWAAFYETAVARQRSRSGLLLAMTGLAVAATACFVDLRCTPRRLTPGFERRLSSTSLTLVYLVFGLALPLGARLLGGSPGTASEGKLGSEGD